jgi:Uri superfamily endonuclease
MADVKGTYGLVLALDKETQITVGKLTSYSFPPGYYLYIGSALGGLYSRIGRHIHGGSKLHWHIDYLRQVARVVEVWYRISDERMECSWYHAAAGMPGAEMPVAGFGSSGCSCDSHLLHFTSRPSGKYFRQLLGSGGRNLQGMPVR